MGFRVRFGVWPFGFRDQGVEFMAQGSSSGCGFRVGGSWLNA